MKSQRLLALLLLFFLSGVWSASSEQGLYTRANFLKLEAIFEQQLILVQSLEERIEKLQNDLGNSQSLLKKDTKELKGLRDEYEALKSLYKREKKLLNQYRRDLEESQRIRQRLENSLKEARQSFDQYSKKVLGDKIVWGLSGAAIGAAAATGTILLLRASR